MTGQSAPSPRVPLGEVVRVSEEIVARVRAAGINEDDPDFAALVEAECDGPERVRRLLRAARGAEAQADALAPMLADMRERKARLDRRGEEMRRMAAWALAEMGLTRLVAPEFTASLRPGRPALVGEPDPAALPDDLVRTTRTANRTAIRDALAAGRPVPGCSLGNAAPVLTLTTK